MKPLLRLLKYLAEHPEKTLMEVSAMPQFSKGYKLLVTYAGRKMLFCPCCRKRVPLSKHHIRPKKNSGKGVKNNFIYICRRPCHDTVHEMFNKKQKIGRYVLEHPNATIDELVAKVSTTKQVVIQVLYPEYYLRLRAKYKKRIGRKILAGMELLANGRVDI